MALAPEEVGARIRQARLAKGWTHDELAAAMHVNSRTVQRWQKGRDPTSGKSWLPRLKTLMRLADVLGVQQSYFVELDDGEPSEIHALREELAEVRAMVQSLLDAEQNPPA